MSHHQAMFRTTYVYKVNVHILGSQKAYRVVIQSVLYIYIYNTAVAQWLRCCATNRKVAGSTDIKSFRSHYGTGVDSASNRNEYQEHFLGVKVAGA